MSRWASAPGRVGTTATLAESGALRHPAHRINVPAQFEENPTRAEFLREYGVRRLLKRLPTAQEPATKIAYLCRRAVELLLDQDDHARATRAIDQATTLAPQHPDLPQLRVRLEQLKITQQPTEPPPPPEAVPLEPPASR